MELHAWVRRHLGLDGEAAAAAGGGADDVHVEVLEGGLTANVNCRVVLRSTGRPHAYLLKICAEKTGPALDRWVRGRARARRGRRPGAEEKTR